MITAIDFPEKEFNFTYPGCFPVPAYRQTNPETGETIVITKWKIPIQDLKTICDNDGEFYVKFFFDGMPPVSIMAESPFMTDQQKEATILDFVRKNARTEFINNTKVWMAIVHIPMPFNEFGDDETDAINNLLLRVMNDQRAVDYIFGLNVRL